MSTFTRTTTPAFSANPFQTFLTYKQARRAAKGGGAVAFVFGALSAVGIFQFASMNDVRMPQMARQTNLAILVVLTLLLFLLGWRIWVRPGPWKVSAILAFVVLSLAGLFAQFSILNFVIVGVTLNFTVIALRGAWAMKRLQAAAETQAKIDVF